MLTRENILKAKNNLEMGIGGGNTTQICIEALKYALDQKTHYSCNHDCDALYEAYNKGRADAIEECYIKAKTMMDDIRYDSSNKRNGKAHAMYCVQALEFLRQVAEQLKEQK